MCLCSYEEISFLIQCQMVLLPHINFLISKHNKTTKIDPKIIVCTPSLSAGGGVVVVGNVGLNLLPNLQKRGWGLDILHMSSCLVCTWFQHLLYKFKRHCKLHLNYHPMKDLLAFASGHLVKFCNFYPQLSLEIVFPALKLTHFIS